MYCSNCGNEVGENNKFCPNCGTPVGGTKQTNTQPNQSGLVLDSFDYEKFERAYVGEKYDDFKNKSFSWPAFFLGSIYFIYRKQYLYAFILIIISLFVPIPLVTSIVAGFIFNSTYLKDVHSKVAQIKLKNIEKSEDELLEICKNKGGTSIGKAILFVIICLGIIIAIVALFLGFVYYVVNNSEETYPENSEINEEYNWGDYYNEDYNEEEQYSYNKEGQIGINTIMKYIVPSNYKKVEDYSEEYVYENGSLKCGFSAKLIKENLTPEDYFNKNASGYQIYTLNSKDLEFKYVVKENDNQKQVDYINNQDGMLYLLSFTSKNDTNGICEDGTNKIINSIELNKINQTNNNYSNLKNISYDEYKTKISNLDSFILVVTNTGCGHCIAYKPVLNKVLSEYNLTAYNLEMDMMSDTDYKEFNSSIYIHGTPTTIFIENGKENSIGERLIGNAPEDRIIERLKQLNYIKDDNPIESNA